MKEEFNNLKLIKNEESNRFEMAVENQIALIDYKEYNGKIYLIHTEVPEGLSGNGVASAIVEKALHYIEANNYKLVALCPMVVAYIRRHPEWKRILDLKQSDII